MAGAKPSPVGALKQALNQFLHDAVDDPSLEPVAKTVRQLNANLGDAGQQPAGPTPGQKASGVLHDSRGDSYRPGDKADSAGDRIMGGVDSRGDRLTPGQRVAAAAHGASHGLPPSLAAHEFGKQASSSQGGGTGPQPAGSAKGAVGNSPFEQRMKRAQQRKGGS